jgi:hypothetical protein
MMLGFYETEWGVFITAFSSITLFLAEQNPTKWQKWAVLSSEFGMVFNIVITPIFWLFLYPNNPPMPKVDIILETCHHSFPIIVSVANLVLNNQYFLKKNAKDIFYAGITYLFVNAIGSYLDKAGIYPWPLDWSKPLETIVAYVFQAVLLYLIHMQLARYTQSIFKKK